MKKNLPNFYLAGFAVLVMVVLVAASYIFWHDYFRISFLQKKTILRNIIPPVGKLKESKIPEVSLTLSSTDKNFKVKQAAKVEVQIDSQGKEVWGADLKIVFDPFLAVKKVSAGDFFTDPLVLENLINDDKREVWFSIGSLKPASGKGVLAVLDIEPKSEGKLSLTFSPKTQVSIRGQEKPAVVDYRHFSFQVVQ